MKLVNINTDFIKAMFNTVKVESGIRVCPELTFEEKGRQVLPNSPILKNQQTYCLCETCNVKYKKNRIRNLYLKECQDEFDKYNDEYNIGKKRSNKSADYLIIGSNKKNEPVCLVLEDKGRKTRSAKDKAKKQIKETIFVLCNLYEKNISGGIQYSEKNIVSIIPCFYRTKIDLSITGKKSKQGQPRSKNFTTSRERHGKLKRSELSIVMCGKKAKLHTLGPKSLKNKKDWENITNQATPYWESI